MLPNARASRIRPAPTPDSRPPPRREPGNKTQKSETRIIIARGDRLQAIHFNPRLMALAGACFVLFSVFYFASTAYLVFRDDWLRRDSGGEAVLRETYEDRISALRNEIERITSRRLVDHATVEQKVEQLLDRQDELGQRQDMLARLTEAARRAGFDVTPPPPPLRRDGKQASADTIAIPKVSLASASGATARDPLAPLPGTDRIASIETNIAAMETAQDATVTELASGVTTRADRISALLKRVGRKMPRPAVEDDVGGPFVPLPMATEPDRFASGVAVLSAELERLATVRKVALSLPWSQPIANAPISSGFGARVDPFLGRPAMHTGIDFRAPRNYPARAVAAGRVIAAEWNGGYGNMVDIDHGNGVVTRYGHLDSISVQIGDQVAAGGRIGRVGSTGRSTGPHLHYEIRVDGEAIDPMRFLIAGKEMTRLL